jgi:sorting nexin-1/2
MMGTKQVISTLSLTMDGGFDDLLAPSRRTLEENPFDDPFAKRSSSPDPWASPFAQQDSPEIEQPSLFYEPPSVSHHEESAPVDPLESPEETLSEPPLRSPGFLESIPKAFSETATIRPTVPEDEEPSIPTPVEEHARSPRSPSPIAPPSPPVRSAEPPKPEPTPLGLTPSFTNLALGGESPSGWQEEQSSSWSGPSRPQEENKDDDSDDDKPIAQSARLAERVSLTFTLKIYA